MSGAGISIPAFDPSLLVNYYNSKLPANTAQLASATALAQKANSATAKDVTPWSATTAPAQEVQDAKLLGTTNFLDLSSVPKNAGNTPDAKTEQDNQKLFALYQALNTLAGLAKMSQRDGMTSGQLAGFDTRFQQGMSQVQSFISSETFNNFTLQATQPSSSVTSKVSIPFAPFNYTGSTIANHDQLLNALGNVGASDSFTISVKKAGVSTDVAIDLSQVSGPLTIDNIVAYVNTQLSADGFSTRFKRVMTTGTIDDPTKATYGISINSGASEKITLSSASATPALYLAGSTGSATGTPGTTSKTTGTVTGGAAPDQQGRLIKLTDLDSAPRGVFNLKTNPDNGTTTAGSTVVDANGNVYMLGTATGDFGNQLNQGSNDVVLSKYDSAGNLQWTRLLGSAGDANGTLALDPNGGVVVAGSTNANLITGAVANGKDDSFVAKYDTDGNQTWVKQIQTLSANQGMSVNVDAQSNVYVGGQVTGLIGSGQTNSGNGDGYVAKYDSKGALVYEQQLGTSAADQVSATATISDGGLVVASVQNGHAIVSKYANGDARSAALWQVDLGDLQNKGAIGGLTVSGNNIYVSGTTANASLDAGGAATIANASTGGTDAFVFALTDSGTSASADRVSYVGTGANDKGGAMTVGPDGTVYLTGTTLGTFAGETRNVANTDNTFVSALASNGSVTWTRQYGGADGQSTGQGVAIDPTGTSVLDALGLPRGLVGSNQSVDLAANSTLRTGDSFSIKIDGAATRTATITVAAGETMNSLADKINNALVFAGSATATYAHGGKALKISVNPGITATLIAGPADFDALARLGISPGMITNPSKDGKPAATATASSKQVFGLGFSGKALDISTKTDAGAARAQLLNVLSSVRNAYRTSNAPHSPVSTPQATGPAPAYLTNQIANYETALSALTALNSTSTTG
jgi:hypothetical protein